MAESRIGVGATVVVLALAVSAIVLMARHGVTHQRPRAVDAVSVSETPPADPGPERPVAPTPAARAPSATVLLPPPADVAPASNDEAEIMALLRELKSSDPPTTLALVREGNERFPDSPDVPERIWFEARALVDLSRFDEAQEVARSMLEQYPGNHFTEDVRHHLLSHPLGLPPRPR